MILKRDLILNKLGFISIYNYINIKNDLYLNLF
jgi:hypothetical protein